MTRFIIVAMLSLIPFQALHAQGAGADTAIVHALESAQTHQQIVRLSLSPPVTGKVNSLSDTSVLIGRAVTVPFRAIHTVEVFETEGNGGVIGFVLGAVVGVAGGWFAVDAVSSLGDKRRSKRELLPTIAKSTAFAVAGGLVGAAIGVSVQHDGTWRLAWKAQ
jgi:hypothetical protein